MNRREALKKTATLTGIAVTASASVGLLNGCVPTGDPGFQPTFLTLDQFKLVSSFADMILPKTDTLGALDVHVPEFIDLMLKDNYDAENQSIFKNGIDQFEKEFDDYTQEEKEKTLTALEDSSIEKYTQTSQKSFYLILKELTVLGFYSSEYVMNNMLNYHPVAGRYEPCIPLKKEDKLYVDNNVNY